MSTKPTTPATKKEFMTEPTAKRLINKKTLRAMVPLSLSTIDTLEKNAEFPKRFALTARCVVWDLDDVLAWMSARKEAGLQAARPKGVRP